MEDGSQNCTGANQASGSVDAVVLVHFREDWWRRMGARVSGTCTCRASRARECGCRRARVRVAYARERGFQRGGAGAGCGVDARRNI